MNCSFNLPGTTDCKQTLSPSETYWEKEKKGTGKEWFVSPACVPCLCWTTFTNITDKRKRKTGWLCRSETSNSGRSSVGFALYWEVSGPYLFDTRAEVGRKSCLSFLAVFGRYAPSMTTWHVDRAVLAAHHEIVDISERERHGGDSYSFGLLEHQFHAVLWRGEAPWNNMLNKLPAQALC